MHALSTGSAAPTAQLPGLSTAPTAPAAPSNAASDLSGDLLADMNPAMNAAFAVGRPTDASGAASILATTGSYINGANATIDKLDTGIKRRERELHELRLTDPDAAQHMQTQIDLLQRLRDRIQLSIERVSETIAGSDAASKTSGARHRDEDQRTQRRHEELELLEQRRQLLAGTGTTSIAPVDASMVAGTYGAGGSAGASGGVAGGTA